MAATPTEMDNSFVFLIDLQGNKIWGDEIKIRLETHRILVISYERRPNPYVKYHPLEKKFDLPHNANMDEISAVTHNRALLVSVNKVSRSREVTIKVVKGEPQT
ncbi:hypothetical protein MKW92_018495 [Papaver armeniacum]|nr:hypothetical protein MKW92_018495 [Papaver armeniacum]